MNKEKERTAPKHVVLFGTMEQTGFGDRATDKVVDLYETMSGLISVARKRGILHLSCCAPGIRDMAANGNAGPALDLLFEPLEQHIEVLTGDGVRLRKYGMDGETRTLGSEKPELTFNLLPEYDGRYAMQRAIVKIAEKIQSGALKPDEVTIQMLDETISPADTPAPDLVIFTGGLRQLGNGLLWSEAYSEFCFTDTLINELSGEEFSMMLEDYQGRNRRFGGLSTAQDESSASKQKSGFAGLIDKVVTHNS